jgi:hypothetical protein
MLLKKILIYLKRHASIYIILLFTSVLLLNTILVSANDTNFSNRYPVNNSTIKVANPKITIYVKHTDELVEQSLDMKLNNTPVEATFQYKGIWINDYYEGDIWYVLDRREGTISYNALNLKDGLNTVDVSMSDKAGNLLTDSWSFYVAEPPKFDNINPLPNSEQSSVNQLSSILSDNSSVNWDTVKLKINNNYVNPETVIINKENGTISYNHNLPTGTYTAGLEAKDSSGNMGTRNWSFIIDATPPELAYLYDFKEGVTITDGKLKIRASLKDLVDIKDNVSLSLDGFPLNIDFNYEGVTDYYGDYIITSKKVAYISYEGVVPNGNHLLSLYSEDKLGNKITRNWNFTVSAEPIISNESPLKYGVDQLKPTISAVVKSPNGSVSPEAIVLKLNGETVNFNYDATTGLVSFTPAENLKNESYHTVNLTVMDQTGLSKMREWKFYTNTYPDMKDSNYTSCISCHPANSFEGSNGPLEDIHSKKLSFEGNHSWNNCQNCHNFITYPAECSQCHADFDNDTPYAPHGSTSSIKYKPTNYNHYFPIRVAENREMVDCVICHQPGVEIMGYEGYIAIPTRTLISHDIPELHKNPDESCIKCHAQSLTHEHAREGRIDNDGNIITCNTCHQSTIPEVVQAINNKDTSCSACHGEASHDELHIFDTMSENCTGCHSNTLTIEHTNKDVNCAACHNSEDPIVVKAIENKDKSCETCHTKPIHLDIHSQCKTCHSNTSVVNEH